MKQHVYRYQLRTLKNSWLGDIREFILRIDRCYFSGKMLISTDERSKKLEMKCYKFSEKILPALKEAIKKELEDEA